LGSQRKEKDLDGRSRPCLRRSETSKRTTGGICSRSINNKRTKARDDGGTRRNKRRQRRSSRTVARLEREHVQAGSDGDGRGGSQESLIF